MEGTLEGHCFHRHVQVNNQQHIFKRNGWTNLSEPLGWFERKMCRNARIYGPNQGSGVKCPAPSFFLAKAINMAMMLLGRIIAGFSVGLLSGNAPVYTSEIAPPALRGALVTGFQFAITVSLQHWVGISGWPLQRCLVVQKPIDYYRYINLLSYLLYIYQKSLSLELKTNLAGTILYLRAFSNSEMRVKSCGIDTRSKHANLRSSSSSYIFIISVFYTEALIHSRTCRMGPPRELSCLTARWVEILS